MSRPTSEDESLLIEKTGQVPGEEPEMLYTTFIHTENDYHREQLSRAFRPVLSRRAAKALERNDRRAA